MRVHVVLWREAAREFRDGSFAAGAEPLSSRIGMCTSRPSTRNVAIRPLEPTDIDDEIRSLPTDSSRLTASAPGAVARLIP